MKDALAELHHRFALLPGVGGPPVPGRFLAVRERGDPAVPRPAVVPPPAAALRSSAQEKRRRRLFAGRLRREKELPVLPQTVSRRC